MLKHTSREAAPVIHPWRWDWWNSPLADLASLTPGEALWIGPIPDEGLDWDRRSAVPAARAVARKGIAIHVRWAGRYMCFKRLRRSRPLKLGDWKDIEKGEEMLVHPEPTADDIERAHARCQYLKAKRQGHYRPRIEANQSLWIERLS